MTVAKSAQREEIIASIMKYGREESRLSIIFRELVANRFGISVTDSECMDFLMERGSATAGDLAKITGLTTGAITGTIRRLKKAGLVTAKSDPSDKRRVIVRPIMKKVRAGIQLYASFGNSLNELYAQYTLDQLKFVADYHRRMGEIFSNEIKKLNGLNK